MEEILEPVDGMLTAIPNHSVSKAAKSSMLQALQVSIDQAGDGVLGVDVLMACFLCFSLLDYWTLQRAATTTAIQTIYHSNCKRRRFAPFGAAPPKSGLVAGRMVETLLGQDFGPNHL